MKKRVLQQTPSHVRTRESTERRGRRGSSRRGSRHTRYKTLALRILTGSISIPKPPGCTAIARIAARTSKPATTLPKHGSASPKRAASGLCDPGPWLRVLSTVEMYQSGPPGRPANPTVNFSCGSDGEYSWNGTLARCSAGTALCARPAWSTWPALRWKEAPVHSPERTCLRKYNTETGIKLSAASSIRSVPFPGYDAGPPLDV
mmetsp:Transcript_20235/g.66976  ORF Transcript_20235/g.66976 Transcript_20235/m.66976 type:complete len:204 (+) Transcript_20235:142-753(+)